MARALEKKEGRTNLGTLKARGEMMVQSKLGTTSTVVLRGSAGDYWLWVDDVGKLRIGTSEPTNFTSDGAIVGTQST